MGDAATEQQVFNEARDSATVLVVEDDPDVREIVAGILADFGYRTFIARTSPEALAILQNDRSADLLLGGAWLIAKPRLWRLRERCFPNRFRRK